ncbi:hypothetical protein EPUS_02595 [Endocarpon pusillum Z07020]|uniref:Uncharacterized protein n=1 Tax=Endocarpon pusillum (strain Z07020 / HMAS-L-300199) TaxID=1263415 RepID=U1I462_ENDPU|nr:uncharacterized protein EPUS_02595 [Endocarpon pusillum Z07020]ERF76884.1 hypothetical protein EPUS_02595 [Endocarpon pusillum Z07020]
MKLKSKLFSCSLIFEIGRKIKQIILDLCMSKHGRLGTRSETLDEGAPVFFSHNGVIWATSYDFVRIGMEALCASLEVMFRVMTGEELRTIAFVYFVGDTPESDIRGTNDFDGSVVAAVTGIPYSSGSKLSRKERNLRSCPRLQSIVSRRCQHGMQRESAKSLIAADVLAPLTEGIIPEEAAAVD